MEFLLHPSTTTWRLNFDCRKQVAEGARDGDLLCQAEMFSHLTLFANYEDPKNPRVSRIRAKWLENIKAQIHLEDDFRRILIINALPLLEQKNFVLESKDPRVFRLYPMQQQLLSQMTPDPDSVDYMFYTASIKKDQELMKKASKMGSLEATLYLMRHSKKNFYLKRAREQGWITDEIEIDVNDEEYLDLLFIPK